MDSQSCSQSLPWVGPTPRSSPSRPSSKYQRKWNLPHIFPPREFGVMLLAAQRRPPYAGRPPGSLGPAIGMGMRLKGSAP